MLDLVNALKRHIPTRLQLSSHVTFGRIDQLVTPRRERGIITSPFKIPLKSGSNVLVRSICLLRGKDRRLNCSIRHRFEGLHRHGLIDCYPSDPEAQPRADVAVVTPTLVSMGI